MQYYILFLSIDANLGICFVAMSPIAQLCHFSAPLPHLQQSVHFMSDIDSSRLLFCPVPSLDTPSLVVPRREEDSHAGDIFAIYFSIRNLILFY